MATRARMNAASASQTTAAAGDPADGLIAAAPVVLDVQAGKRMLFAIVAAGVFSLLACTAFYLFEIERLTRQQLAALAHHAGQTINATDLDWQRQARARIGPLATADGTRTSLSWHYDAGDGSIARVVGFRLADGHAASYRYPLDTAWLIASGRSDLRIFLAWRGRVLGSSLGEAGAGEAAALDTLLSGRIARHDELVVQAPMRWDELPDSPVLVFQQRLFLPFSLAEIALAGLFLWALLAATVWMSVGIWLNKALQQIQFMAYHDPLTGLINRAGLRVGLAHMLAESRRNQQLLVVFYLDLDRFKTINDSLGHAAGDLVLKEAARRLLACVRDSDFVARVGGDEFVVVVGELVDPNDAAAIARKIIASLAEPVAANGLRLQTGCSIGIATFSGSPSDPDSLIKQADSAMYAAKQEGRGRYHYYDESLGAKADQRLSLEMKMRQAMHAGAFALHYQPVVSRAGTTQLIGFEALLRWRDDDRDMAPDEFIPVAEESGLIVELGDWVLRTACRQMQSWRLRFAHAQTLSVSVNVSIRQLHAGDFAARVEHALADSGLPASALILELTESLYVDSHTAVPKTLLRLREIGVRLAMDDFGTGYSALLSLSRLPINRLKIDRSFVEHITDALEELAIARSIIVIARQLGLEVVAEGVETEAQAKLLAANGCHVLQGWLFDHALCANDAERWIALPETSAHENAANAHLSRTATIPEASGA